MILVSNGCSHTSGAELDETNTDYCYEKAWPKYLAEFLGLKNINLSRSGASNDRIVRTTYSWISKYLSAGKNPKDLFVVIMWTGIHRTEIATDDNDDSLYFHDGWFPLIIGNDEEYKLILDKPTYLFYKSWVLRNTTRYTHTKFYMNILGIQSFLKSLGIKYLFWSTTITLIDSSPEMKTFFNLIDKKCFPYATDKNFNFMNIASRREYKISDISLKGNFKSHYDENAQIDFAKYLHKIITSRDLLK